MSLSQALLDTLKLNFVPKEIKQERLRMCEDCEFKEGRNCAKCACFIDWKTAMPKEKCPVGKWNEYPPVM